MPSQDNFGIDKFLLSSDHVIIYDLHFLKLLREALEVQWNVHSNIQSLVDSG